MPPRRRRARADAANVSKTRFLAAASHDLLQPLNAARLFLSALAETELPQSAERLIENVDLAFESIDRLLTALLDISKLDAGVVTPMIDERALGSPAAPAGDRVRAAGRAQGPELAARAHDGGGPDAIGTCSRGHS